MKPGDGSDGIVLRQVRDGAGRGHDLCLYLVMRPGEASLEVSLSCPSAYWSITFTPAQGDVLAPAIKDACDRARQVSQ